MKLIAVIVLMLCMFNASFGQQTKTTGEIKFNSINNVGVATGSSGEGFIVQSIIGVRKGKWSAGIGVGFDFYVDKSVPLFIDVRTDILDKKSTPFVYADAGLNFPKLNFIQREQRNLYKTSEGFYSDFGAGWKFKIKNRSGIVVSVGYTYKQTKGEGAIYNFNPMSGGYEQSIQYQDFRYRRYSLKVGFQF